MADIRVQYLRFAAIEAEANSPVFTKRDVPALLTRLRALLAEAPSLSRRFIDLNKDDFYLAELQQENALRTVRLKELYDRLNRSR